MSAVKKAKTTEEIGEAFGGGRTVAALVNAEVLRFEGGGRSSVIKAQLSAKAGEEPHDCLLSLEQKAACEDAQGLLDSLSSLSLTCKNYSGAEYSFYDATTADGAGRYNIEVIYPAKEWQIKRKLPAENDLVEETAALYARVVEPHATSQAAKIGWIDSVCSLESEKERNLHSCEDFIVNVDTKWSTHADCSSSDRATWHKADFTRDLYLLAISKNVRFRSIRDLEGEEGAKLCDAMRDVLRATALEVYGVPKRKLRVFFHYHPRFYRLHAHCTRVEFTNPGCEAERAHLLTTVAENLRRDSAHYATATLTYKLKVGESLHKRLTEDGHFKDDDADTS